MIKTMSYIDIYDLPLDSKDRHEVMAFLEADNDSYHCIDMFDDEVTDYAMEMYPKQAAAYLRFVEVLKEVCKKEGYEGSNIHIEVSW